MNRPNRVTLLVAFLLTAVFALSGLALADGPESSFDQKYLNPEYIAYSGAVAIAEQARVTRNAAAFDGNFTMVGSIVRNLQAEMEMTQEVRWGALAEFYAESTVNSSDAKLSDGDYIANSGIGAIAEQARAVHTASRFDRNFWAAGSIVHNLQAEMEVAQALRSTEMAAFYADNGLLTIDPDVTTAYRWEAMARFREVNGLLNEIVEAVVQENANR
jgi:hypothetical protein